MLGKKKRLTLIKPASVEVRARRLDPDLTNLPRFWADNDPFLTHFMNALSVTFPGGERMFMDAVRAVRDRVKSPEVLRDIAGFMAQEALHSRAHHALNDHLDTWGYPGRAMEQAVRDDIARERRFHTDKSLLALTCALEHITAMMGELLLSREDIQQMAHEDIRPLWLWHAIEETEHKAVAFDVYQEVYGDYFTRVLWLVLSTFGLLGGVSIFQRELLAVDRLNKPSVWAKGLWKLWGPKGILIGLVPMWLDYFRPNFHPWQHDNSARIEQYRALLDRLEAATRGSVANLGEDAPLDKIA